jgi:hypothetical protein
MSISNKSEFEHKAILTTVGLALEDMSVTKEGHTVNEVAKKAQRHHQTVRNALEEIYYIQHFIPEIDLMDEKGRILVHVKDLPRYIKISSEPEDTLLVKLFHAKAYFGHKIPISSLNLSDEEMLYIKKEVLSGNSEWIVVDHRSGTIGLTIEGSKRAFKKVEEFSDIRDTAIVNVVEGAAKLRARAKPHKEPEIGIDMFLTVMETIGGVQNMRRHNELLAVLPSLLSRIEHAQHVLEEIKDFLYKHTNVGRPNEIFIHRG